MLVPENHFLFHLKKRNKLAKILRIDPINFKNMETTFTVLPFYKKVSGKQRALYNTDKSYKALLRRLNRLFHQLNLPGYVYGGVPKRDFLDNAYAHHQRPYIQTVDIQNFFPSTRDSYVYGLFKHKFNASPDVSKILTLLTTYPNKDSNHRHIPQGFPTSTALSFLAYFDLFNGINELCKKQNIHFTLFVDDMTFSSYKKIPKSFIRHVDSIVKKHDLSLNPSKIKRYNMIQPKNITGVIIDPKTKVFKAPNKLQRKIYQNLKLLHDFEIISYESYVTWKKIVLKLNGQVSALKRIEPYRELPYISKVLEDIKSHFYTPSVKRASYQELHKEYITYAGEVNEQREELISP